MDNEIDIRGAIAKLLFQGLNIEEVARNVDYIWTWYPYLSGYRRHVFVEDSCITIGMGHGKAVEKRFNFDIVNPKFDPDKLVEKIVNYINS